MEGRTTRYHRARSYTPSADDLKAFAGRYGNDENKVVFEMTPSKAGLSAHVSWNESQPFAFVPVDRDTFQFRRMIVRFTRDKAGAVVGLEYSNPVVRNITFTRPGDR